AGVAAGRRGLRQPQRELSGVAGQRAEAEATDLGPLEQRPRLVEVVRRRGERDDGGETVGRAAERGGRAGHLGTAGTVVLGTGVGAGSASWTRPQISHGFGRYGSLITCASPQRRTHAMS